MTPSTHIVTLQSIITLPGPPSVTVMPVNGCAGRRRRRPSPSGTFYSPTLCQSFKLRQGITILITYIVGPEPGSQAGELRLAGPAVTPCRRRCWHSAGYSCQLTRFPALILHFSDSHVTRAPRVGKLAHYLSSSTQCTELKYGIFAEVC